MIKLSEKQIGWLEFCFGTLFLIATIVSVFYTVNTFYKEVPETFDIYNSILSIKYNLSIDNGFLEMSNLSNEQQRTIMSEYLIFVMDGREKIMIAAPIFMLSLICALAVSFILIFQGFYHWNKEN